MPRSNTVSVATISAPEFINLKPMDINPLMSKCEIKVLYVGENRNRSVISKKVATEMSKTLRGAPIVGQYVESKQDFNDHGHQMVIDRDGVKFNTLTKPYGFVSPDSRVWFQTFTDRDEFGNEEVREYLMTEGYLWTEQFPECKPILEHSNPQSMELHEKTLKGHWSKDTNSGIKFFIINDAIFSKLCVLGNDVEPCFEGANVSKPMLSTNFSANDTDFTVTLFSMIEQLKDTLNNNKGGYSMANVGVENLTEQDKIVENTQFENQSNIEGTPVTNFDGESSGDATSGDSSTDSAPTEGDDSVIVSPSEPENSSPDGPSVEAPDIPDVPTESESNTVIQAMTEEERISTSDVKGKGVVKKIFSKEEDDKEDKKPPFLKDKEDDKSDDSKSKDDKSDDKEDEDKKKKEKYQLLEKEMEELKANYALLESEVQTLREFKQEAENEKKEALINSFYMLSDEDKQDVIDHKSEYSLEDIEAKLSVICVRKKVNFDLEESDSDVPYTYNLESGEASTLPAWLQAVEDVTKRED